ncbi:cytochrome c biogenesis protein ResB [Chitinimonas sp. BJYL2]|uniref:cytochrome c biogenesis protein ResB n=1 Tax=Chitinimonas sp. BJYL2 TaxID=2976696 RepID=UPI0022B53980|nr:cytochrome c biogenesis protein ResB [Chitinimonas sp. BJYL2]
MRRLSFARALFELFSSMRFAISLLTILAIASVIGTVLQQNRPYPDYVFEFGDFWFQPFERLGLFDVYHASWFLIILLFLVISTSLCIYRQLPGIVRDIKSWREQAGLKSLRSMHHHDEHPLRVDAATALSQAQAWFAAQGYKFKQVERPEGTLLVAKKGALQRLGYLLAHAAIVVICIGGLLDGNLPLKLQALMGNKQPELRNVPQSQIPGISRLPASNGSFRANIDVPEGGVADVAFLNAGRGYYVQELPFLIRLKKFHIEHYSSGQPKLFASDIEVIEKDSGKITTATVKVNHPLIVDGVAIYQSSFGDGGSKLQFAMWDWTSTSATSVPLAAVSQNTLPFDWAGTPLTLEFGELRPFNIESLPDTAEAAGGMAKMIQDAREVRAPKRVKNLGPSVQFKVRDGQGQAREYLNYLAPFEEDGRYYMMTGMRSEQAAPFAFVRVPLDAEFKPDGFMRLKAVLRDPSAWAEIARRTADKAASEGAVSAEFRAPFEQSVRWVLQRFSEGGFVALEQFLDDKVPQDKRKAVAQTYIKLLQGAVIDADAVANERAGRAPVAVDEKRYRFLMDVLVAMSASFDYGSPFWLQPVGFEEVKSSGFQVARSPGQPLVYLGSLLLVLGIFCMFYIRENRIWVWALDRGDQPTLLLALSSNRRDALTEREFASHRAALVSMAGAAQESTT